MTGLRRFWYRFTPSLLRSYYTPKHKNLPRRSPLPPHIRLCLSSLTNPQMRSLHTTLNACARTYSGFCMVGKVETWAAVVVSGESSLRLSLKRPLMEGRKLDSLRYDVGTHLSL